MKPRKACRCEHDFTLVLTGIAELNSEVEDALFKAGCDDATLSMRSGRPYMTFSRTADSLKHAILSAIKSVRKAGIGADILRVDVCNLVTQADVARRIGCSRQLVNQYIRGTRGPGGFPPPACDITDDSPLFYWCEIAYWLWENDMIREDILREAQDVAVINCVLELQYQKKVDPALTEEVIRFIETSELAPEDSVCG